MPASPAPKPVIVVVDDDPSGEVARALRHRYDRDYDVAALAGDDLASVSERSVALVVAAATDESPVFSDAARMFPDARRALLIAWGAWADAATAARVLELMSELQIDYYLVRPQSPDDEHFHRSVTEFLREWRGTASPTAGFTVVGPDAAARTHILAAMLARTGVGVSRLEPDAAREILGPLPVTDAPIVRTATGELLVDPDDRQIARASGLVTAVPAHDVDVTIVGAGPAGLAAAVYAASEGLRTLVVERGPVGGQAGSSSLIRNYLGFPRGVSGAELASRAYQQAWAFGASFAHARTVAGLIADDTGFELTVDPGGESVRTRSVVVATGVSYRRLSVAQLRPFEGASVFFGASSVEARAQRGRSVFVVGGGNSAGQAALHLARYAASVSLLVRGATLAESMSQYLIDQLAALGVRIVHLSRVVGARADDTGRLSAIEIENVETGERSESACQAVFITIGARPHTAWLPGEVLRDRWGYVFTGASQADEDEPDPWHGRAEPGALETSLPGVFAVGDTRRGSLKRVASAVGEGSVVVSAVHTHLARR